MKTPINRQTLRQHISYSWWKYALIIVLGTVLVNIYYTVTTYRSPAEKKIELYIYGYGNQDAIDAWMEEIRVSEMPDMEEMHSVLLSTDKTYGVMQLSTYIGAAEGDIYILPRNNFVSLATTGAWAPLEEDAELLSIFTAKGINLQSGWRRESDSGESHLFGIPVSALPGLNEYLAVDNGFVCVLISNGNQDNVMRFLRILCQRMMQPQAEP